MENYSSEIFIYTGWGWIILIGLVVLMISGISHWGHSYLIHRSHQDSLKINSRRK
jgi:hypothetical protein